ncbi:UNVERIFIED_CONTAM: hypothetical protein Scaly_2943100 [Sesamum calycinum]|uniref:Uncharacterized protein n=1 Tax=Sesamum calycinum TaxID=2727403 RepID=A0AAW2KX55_9LAMI
MVISGQKMLSVRGNYVLPDAESLVYMLYYSSGGDLLVLDSVEGALQWRETSWSRRLIQQKLGDISAVLKAFADYVDSLCSTPYPIDYGVWLRRLRRHINTIEPKFKTLKMRRDETHRNLILTNDGI